MEPVNPYASPLAPGEETAFDAADRSLSLLGALSGGTALYARRFPTLAAMTLTVWAPVEAFVSYQEYFVLAPDNILGVVNLSVLADSLVGIIVVGGVIHVGEAAARGQRVGWLAGLWAGVQGWPRLFSSRLIGGVLLLLAAIFFLLPAVYLGVRYALSDVTAILERRAGYSALARSMDLTRGRFLIFLGLCVIVIGMELVAGFVLFVPLGFLPQYDTWLVSAALSCVIDLVSPWGTLVFVVAYLQCRTEDERNQASVETVPAWTHDGPGSGGQINASADARDR